MRRYRFGATLTLALVLAALALGTGPATKPAKAAVTALPQEGNCRQMEAIYGRNDIWYGRIIGERYAGSGDRLRPTHRIVCFASPNACSSWVRSRSGSLARVSFAACQRAALPR
ncbi:MAG: hypothetical protein AAF638_05360 [Pseudomonadota bacterium]